MKGYSIFSSFILAFETVLSAHMNPEALCWAMNTFPYFPSPIY